MAVRMRLDKLLSRYALGTRSALKELVRGGCVAVDGQAVRDPGMLIDPLAQSISVQGESLVYRAHRHVMLHKPAGAITAAEDPRLPTVMDLLPPLYKSWGCMPVGRLDRDTEGLLLLTSDGTLAHRLLAPKYHIDKTYYARVDGPLTGEDVAAFAAGLTLSDFTALPATLALLPGEDAALCTVQEGKFHQVKRMFAARGRTVTYLKRLSIGPLKLDDALPLGGYRELTDAEEAALYAACHLTEDTHA